MPRRAREHRLEFRQRVGRAPETQQHIGVLVEDIDVVGRQRARFVEAFERVRRALERMQRLPEIAPRLRRTRIGFDRGAEQPLGFAKTALLQLDAAQKIERVEIIRRGFEHARIDFFRVAQLALPVQRNRLLQRRPGIERTGP